MQCTVTVNDVQYVSAVQVFDPFTAKVSFTEEASQEVSIIEHLQSKHEASDLFVSTSTTHKLEYGTPRRDIFERSDTSLATTKNTSNFPLKIGPLMLIFFYLSIITIMLNLVKLSWREQTCHFVFRIPSCRGTQRLFSVKYLFGEANIA